MNKNLKFLLIFFLFLCLMCMSVNAVSKIGSTGQEVTEIQQLLKKWGYYDGAVDGIFGTATRNAVIKFQRANGLAADGVVGKTPCQPWVFKVLNLTVPPTLIFLPE